MSATATVVIGNTRVVSVLSGEIIAPYPDRPTEGDASLFANDFILIYVWRSDKVPKFEFSLDVALRITFRSLQTSCCSYLPLKSF
jgi:hypothetical protein